MSDPPDEHSCVEAPPSPEPVWIAVGGCVASGKSTLARGIARALGVPLFAADPTRSRLVRRWDASEGPEAARLHSLSPETAGEIYRELVARAAGQLRPDESVVLDGCFAGEPERKLAKEAAEARGARFHLVVCHADPAVIEARLDERDRSAGLPARSWTELAQALLDRWHPPDELALAEVSFVDTDVGEARSLACALAGLGFGPEARGADIAPGAASDARGAAP